jgi:hypothetical protein
MATRSATRPTRLARGLYAFKPPTAGKVPGFPGGKGGGGGGGKVSAKRGPAYHAPKAPAPKPVAARHRALASMGKDPGAVRRFLPEGGGHKSGPRVATGKRRKSE